MIQGKSAASGLRASWPLLFLELVVVVLGITISFGLQSWRQDKQDLSEGRTILESLRDDLQSDIENFEENSKLLEAMVEMATNLHADDRRAKLTPNELDYAIDSTMSYRIFQPTTATWQIIKAGGSLQLIRNVPLRRAVVNHYEQLYAQGREWSDINKKFVLDTMIPFVDSHAGVVPMDFDQPHAPTGAHEILPALLKHAEFKNNLRTSRAFKEAQRLVCIRLGKAAAELRTAIEAELAGNGAQ